MEQEKLKEFKYSTKIGQLITSKGKGVYWEEFLNGKNLGKVRAGGSVSVCKMAATVLYPEIQERIFGLKVSISENSNKKATTYLDAEEAVSFRSALRNLDHKLDEEFDNFHPDLIRRGVTSVGFNYSSLDGFKIYYLHDAAAQKATLSLAIETTTNVRCQIEAQDLTAIKEIFSHI